MYKQLFDPYSSENFQNYVLAKFICIIKAVTSCRTLTGDPASILTLFSMGWGGGIMPPCRFFYAASKRSEVWDETLGLLVSTCWESENVILNHLGVNWLPWQPYC